MIDNLPALNSGRNSMLRLSSYAVLLIFSAMCALCLPTSRVESATRSQLTWDDHIFAPEVYNWLNHAGKVNTDLIRSDPKLETALRSLGLSKYSTLNREQVGQVAIQGLIDSARRLRIHSSRNITQAIFAGNFVPNFDDLELAHAGFGTPSDAEIPDDFKAFMKGAGLDYRNPLNLAGVTARYRNKKFNDVFGTLNETQALRFGHRIGYFRNPEIPEDPNLTVASIRKTLSNNPEKLQQFNENIVSLMTTSAYIYFSQGTADQNSPFNLARDYQRLRTGEIGSGVYFRAMSSGMRN